MKKGIKSKKDPGYADMERYKACVSLYLTVLYLICKNLVKINARYTIAIGCLERDTQLHKVPMADAYRMTKDVFAENNWLNPRKREVRSMLEKYQYATDYLLKTYRNQIAHLAVITNAYKYVSQVKKPKSFFRIYHTIMQMCIVQQIEHDKQMPWWKDENLSPKEVDLLKAAIEYGNYSKDFLHILNLPFGYNLPRYLNLTSENLFSKEG